MKKLGQLYGADVYIDTVDERVFKRAEKTLGNAFQTLYPSVNDSVALDEEVKKEFLQKQSSELTR